MIPKVNSEDLKWDILQRLKSLKFRGIETSFLDWFKIEKTNTWIKKRLAYILVEYGNLEALEFITNDIEKTMEFDTLRNFHELVFLEKSANIAFLPYLIRLLKVSTHKDFNDGNSIHKFKNIVLSALLNLASREKKLFEVEIACSELISSSKEFHFLKDWIIWVIESNRDNYTKTLDWKESFGKADAILE